MKDLVSVVRPALLLLVAFTLIGGLLYPAVVTGAAQVVFPHQAEGSLITDGGKVVGRPVVPPIAMPSESVRMIAKCRLASS